MNEIAKSMVEGVCAGMEPGRRDDGRGNKEQWADSRTWVLPRLLFPKLPAQSHVSGLEKILTLEITFKRLGSICNVKETKATASAKDLDNGEGEGGEGVLGSVLVVASPISGFYILGSLSALGDSISYSAN